MQSKTNDTTMPKGKPIPVILWLASWYPCKLDAFNGDFVQRAAKALALRYPVHVFYLMKDEEGRLTQSHLLETETHGQLTETRLYYHVPKTGIKALDKLRSAMAYTKHGRQWLTQFKQKQSADRPWIVEVGVAMRAGTLALWMKKKWNQPYLVQEHWTGYYRHLMPPDMQRGKLFWQMSRRILVNTDALLPDSRHLGEWINESFLPIPFTEIPNTVDATRFFYIPQTDPCNTTFRFIHVSTMGHQKNTDGLLRAFKIFADKHPQEKIELLVVGPGWEPHKKWVNGQEGLKEKVIFTGPRPYIEVALLMQTAHALVLFSRYENLPCVMLEAFCCGLPVIATRVGGIAYHLPEENGILIDSESEAQLKDALETMFTGYNTYNRATIAQNAATCYSMPAIAELYDETYRRIYPHLFDKKASF
jgi:glycosyltransferase involved in cell wall biosynthesis